MHAKQESTGIAPHPVQGITVHDSDVLEPEPARPGGLMRKDTVLTFLPSMRCSLISFTQRHTFKQPVKAIEPPTPRPSLLGLDKLAQEKRVAASYDNNHDERSRKKPRLDDHDEAVFKSTDSQMNIHNLFLIVVIVPSLPPRVSNPRQRGEETPSHPGGLSEVSRRRLEEHRRNRDKQRGQFKSFFLALSNVD